jgi:PIN domain nuclease of toxin-antitoxin system
VRFLLDTHVVLWIATEPDLLSAYAASLLEAEVHTFHVSSVTSFELSTKHRLGKLPQVGKLLIDFESQMERSGFELLPVTSLHGRIAGAFSCSHRDPFDRILAAQSNLELLPILSVDAELDGFGVQRIW